jgi:EVE domain
MTRSYWLDVFSDETWDQFREHGANVSGFPIARVATTRRMKQGDYLMCYVKGLARWVGILEVTGPAYEDESPIWTADVYPARIPVQALIALDPEYGVPITDMSGELSIFDPPNGGGWGVQLQGSPKLWDRSDGDAVLRALEGARDHPVHRPVPARRRRKALIPLPPVNTEVEQTAADDEAEVGVEVTIPNEGMAGEGGTSLEVRKHSEVQFRLVQMGSDMGFDTHVARNDRNVTWNGKRIVDIDGLRERLSLPFDQKTNETIELIDVLWLDGGQVVAAFEVESTTSIYSGLLRMSDLIAMNPNMAISLYLVAPVARRERVREQLNRPTFAKLRVPLVRICRYIAFEKLISELQEHSQVIRHMKIDWLEDDISESCVRRD